MTLKGFIIANIVSVAILLFIYKLLLPLTLTLFGKMEVYFVNNLGFAFNSGTIFTALPLTPCTPKALRPGDVSAGSRA